MVSPMAAEIAKNHGPTIEYIKENTSVSHLLRVNGVENYLKNFDLDPCDL